MPRLFQMKEGKVILPKNALRTFPRSYPDLESSGVLWTEDATYCLVEGKDFEVKGVRVDILSINGCGEVRWKVPVHYNSTKADSVAVREFEALPIGKWKFELLMIRDDCVRRGNETLARLIQEAHDAI